MAASDSRAARKPRDPHDGSYKSLFDYPTMVRDLLVGFVHEDWVGRLDLDSFEPVGTNHVTDELEQRDQDRIWRVRLRRSAGTAADPSDDDAASGAEAAEWLYLYLLIEFQRRDDPGMPVRVMAYTALLYQDLIRSGKVALGDPLPPVFPIVLYSGLPLWRTACDVAELIEVGPDELRPYRPSLRYFLIDEVRLAEAARKSGVPLPHNLAGVMVGLEGAVNSGEFALLGKALQALMPPELIDSLGRAFTAWINRIVAKRLKLDENVKVLANFQEVAMLGEQVGDLAEIFRREGRDEGIVEGLVTGQVNMLERLLQHRFGTPLPEWVRPRLEKADTARLEHWAERIFEATSLEDLLQEGA